MDRIVFLGDEVTAAGYRLAGAVTHTPDRDSAERIFEDACQSARLIVLSAEVANWIDQDRLDEAQAQGQPLITIVSDIRNRHEPPDLEAHTRKVLGLEL